MGWTSFLVIPVALYVIVSLRVLKQYERGVVDSGHRRESGVSSSQH